MERVIIGLRQINSIEINKVGNGRLCLERTTFWTVFRGGKCTGLTASWIGAGLSHAPPACPNHVYVISDHTAANLHPQFTIIAKAVAYKFNILEKYQWRNGHLQLAVNNALNRLLGDAPKLSTYMENCLVPWSLFSKTIVYRGQVDALYTGYHGLAISILKGTRWHDVSMVVAVGV